MLPRTTHLLAILSFLVEMSVSSPVYNMQPAYITATIGSTGRNIRNLPCISRKSNQSGVCMFAIDCLKANGTHLGTCIDRFYFGSCCHIEPLQDITENTIDSALIPSREPPHRMTTIAPIAANATHPQIKQDVPVTTTPSTTTTTTQKQKIVQTTTQASLPPASATADDIESYKITTFQTVDDVPVTTTPRPTSAKPKPAKTKPTNKPTTPTVTVSIQTTKPPTKVTKPRPQTTPKPTQTYINRNTTLHANATRPHSSTTRPRPKPTKPVKITKPINATVTSNTASNTNTTPAPIAQRTTTTVRSSTTTKSIKLTKKPLVIKGTTGTTTRKPVPVTTTTRLPVTVTTTKPSTATIKTTTKLTTIPPTSASTLSNDVLVNVNATVNEQKPDINVNGNPVTNELEAQKGEEGVKPTTNGPSLVTWSEINKNNTNDSFNVSVSTSPASTSASSGRPSSSESSSSTGSIGTSTSTEDVTNPDDWIPVTDGWVLLPSLTTTQESNDNVIPTLLSSTEKSGETSSEFSASSSTEANSPSSSANTITSSTESATSSVSVSSTSTESTEYSSSTEDYSLSSSSVSTEDNLAEVTLQPQPTPLPISTQTPSAGVEATSGLNMSDFTDVCGRRMVPEGRIVGGEKSAFGKWPWQISLRQWRTSTYLHKCGAALLNENWAITAAHCVDNVPPSDLLLRLGEHDLSTESEPYLHQERRVQIVASHPQFDPRTFEYDLALLRFYEPVTFQPNIIPVCVPQTDENFVGRNAHVTGWGRLYEDGPLPSVLQEVSVPVINNTVCESMYRSAGYIEHIPNIFICAGWRRGGFDSCEGDSGGPMVIQRPDKRFILAGVISWGIGCAEPNQPGVYTRISEFRDWINQILQF